MPSSGRRTVVDTKSGRIEKCTIPFIMIDTRTHETSTTTKIQSATEHFHHGGKFPCAPEQSMSLHPHHTPKPGLTVAIGYFAFSRIWHKWNCTVWGLLCVASFTCVFLRVIGVVSCAGSIPLIREQGSSRRCVTAWSFIQSCLLLTALCKRTESQNHGASGHAERDTERPSLANPALAPLESNARFTAHTAAAQPLLTYFQWRGTHSLRRQFLPTLGSKLVRKPFFISAQIQLLTLSPQRSYFCPRATQLPPPYSRL